MKLDLINCKECGAVVVVRDHQGMCRPCAQRRIEQLEAIYEALDKLDEESLTLDLLAEASGLAPNTVKQHLQNATVLRRDIERRSQPLCSRCHEQNVEGNSDLCLSCRLLLLDRLQAAHIELQHKTDRKPNQRRGWLPPDEQSRASVAQTFQKKRGKTPLGKLDPTPKGRFRS